MGEPKFLGLKSLINLIKYTKEKLIQILTILLAILKIKGDTNVFF
jgi:hypothetical protein